MKAEEEALCRNRWYISHLKAKGAQRGVAEISCGSWLSCIAKKPKSMALQRVKASLKRRNIEVSST